MLKIKTEVKNGLKNKKPIVALESTIISHGLPYPENKELAFELEEKGYDWIKERVKG